MSADIINFPTFEIREQINWEKILRRRLKEAGGSPDMTIEIWERMKEFLIIINHEYRGLSFDVTSAPEEVRKTICDSFKKAFEGFRLELVDCNHRIIFERLCLEIELYNERHGRG
jgi:hypothetical protein